MLRSLKQVEAEAELGGGASLNVRLQRLERDQLPIFFLLPANQFAPVSIIHGSSASNEMTVRTAIIIAVARFPPVEQVDKI